MTSCTHLLPFARVLECITGIEYVKGKEFAIEWICRCGKPQFIPWAGARDPLKAKARQVELENMRLAGAV